MTYDANTYVPSREEAERDIHDHYPCSFSNPCPACVRNNSR